jgi:hypothetical protein
VQAKERKRKKKGFHFLSFIFQNPCFSTSYEEKNKKTVAVLTRATGCVQGFKRPFSLIRRRRAHDQAGTGVYTTGFSFRK